MKHTKIQKKIYWKKSLVFRNEMCSACAIFLSLSPLLYKDSFLLWIRCFHLEISVHNSNCCFSKTLIPWPVFDHFQGKKRCNTGLWLAESSGSLLDSSILDLRCLIKEHHHGRQEIWVKFILPLKQLLKTILYLSLIFHFLNWKGGHYTLRSQTRVSHDNHRTYTRETFNKCLSFLTSRMGR